MSTAERAAGRTTPLLGLELARSPTCVAECHEELLRAFSIGYGKQDIARRRHHDVIIDLNTGIKMTSGILTTIL